MSVVYGYIMDECLFKNYVKCRCHFIKNIKIVNIYFKTEEHVNVI